MKYLSIIAIIIFAVLCVSAQINRDYDRDYDRARTRERDRDYDYKKDEQDYYHGR